MIRAFFALSLSIPEQQFIQQATKKLSLDLGDKVRWLTSDNWHVTLRFLGNVELPIIDHMSQCARTLANQTKVFTYQAKKIAGFPAEKSRMIAIHIESHPTLQQLSQSLEQTAKAIGLTPEEREFRPHITLAKSHDLLEPMSPILLNDLTLTAKEIILYESKPSNKGSHYLPIKKFAFQQ